MRKIPTLFLRNPDNMKQVLPTVNPACEWVLAGEGVATRKYDGTCVAIRAGGMYARQQVKEDGVPPPDFEPVDFDPETGKTQGWVPVTEDKDYRRHWEAYSNSSEGGSARLPDGTYELCGPKVNGNPEGLEIHVLVPHGDDKMDFHLESGEPMAAFVACEQYLLAQPHEGIVWHHPDGRMAKLKRRDFGR